MMLADKFQTIESLLTAHYRSLNKGDKKAEITRLIDKPQLSSRSKKDLKNFRL
jgi:hypothetical protein